MDYFKNLLKNSKNRMFNFGTSLVFVTPGRLNCSLRFGGTLDFVGQSSQYPPAQIKSEKREIGFNFTFSHTHTQSMAMENGLSHKSQYSQGVRKNKE